MDMISWKLGEREEKTALAVLGLTLGGIEPHFVRLQPLWVELTLAALGSSPGGDPANAKRPLA